MLSSYINRKHETTVSTVQDGITKNLLELAVSKSPRNLKATL